MKLHGELSVNGKSYKKGDDVHWLCIYPFFFVHMGMFGLSGFFLAYADKESPTFFLFLHGGFAIFIYTIFYKTIFGMESIKWMFINGALGLFGIYSELDWILSLFGTEIGDYPPYTHIIPFLYYILYTFLLRQAFLDFTRSRDDAEKQRRAERKYIIISMVVYAIFYVI